MSWLTLQNDEHVSFNDLRDAVATNVFLPATTLAAIPFGEERITKLEAATYACLDETAVPFVDLADNEHVIKSDLVPCARSTMTVKVHNLSGLVLNFLTVIVNGINVVGLTAVTMNPTDIITGTSTSVINGVNKIVVSNSTGNITILSTDIKDDVTLSPLSYTTSGNGTLTVTVNPITISGTNIINGIIIRLT
jgi:hypothetical protein